MLAAPYTPSRRRDYSADFRFKQPATKNAILLRLERAIYSQGLSRKGVSSAAGLARNTVRAWLLDGVIPGVDALEAALAVVGLKLVVRRIGEPDPALKGDGRSRLPATNPRTHWIVAAGRDRCRGEGLLIAETVARAGVRRSTAKAWWSAQFNQPRLDYLEAWLSVLGLSLDVEAVN